MMKVVGPKKNLGSVDPGMSEFQEYGRGSRQEISCRRPAATLARAHARRLQQREGFDQNCRWLAIPLVICYSLLLKMAIEIVDPPIKNGDCPLWC